MCWKISHFFSWISLWSHFLNQNCRIRVSCPQFSLRVVWGCTLKFVVSVPVSQDRLIKYGSVLLLLQGKTFYYLKTFTEQISKNLFPRLINKIVRFWWRWCPCWTAAWRRARQEAGEGRRRPRSSPAPPLGREPSSPLGRARGSGEPCSSQTCSYHIARVAKCHFFYTDHFCPTKFTPRKSV